MLIQDQVNLLLANVQKLITVAEATRTAADAKRSAWSDMHKDLYQFTAAGAAEIDGLRKAVSDAEGLISDLGNFGLALGVWVDEVSNAISKGVAPPVFPSAADDVVAFANSNSISLTLPPVSPLPVSFVVFVVPGGSTAVMTPPNATGQPWPSALQDTVPNGTIICAPDGHFYVKLQSGHESRYALVV